MATLDGTTPDAVSAASGERRHVERPIGTRCRPDCKRPSPTQAHCSVCHRTFGGVSGFDEHRTRDGSCTNPAILGMVERDRVWRTPLSPDAAARLYALKGTQ